MPKGKRPSTVEVAEALAKPLLEQMNLILWDVRYEKEGATWYLRYFLEKEDGLTIQDCEDFSRAISDILDEQDPIQGSYVLEVSSPGIERELVKDWHFQAYLGAQVAVRLYQAVEGVRDFVGILADYQDGTITLRLDEDLEMTFQKNEAAFVRLYEDFSAI